MINGDGQTLDKHNNCIVINHDICDLFFFLNQYMEELSENLSKL